MKQVLTRGLKLSLLVALVVSVSLTANYFLMAWIAPTANPPAGNVTIKGVPPNSIMAFNRTTCPAGWVQADGCGGTCPDLRGVFIRGMETFDEGLTSNDRDPDRSGAGTLRDYQLDEFEQHSHNFTGVTPSYSNINPGTGGHGRELRGSYGVPTSNLGIASAGTSNETRSKNVALIYCVKE